MKIYVDLEHKCHITNPGGTYREIDVPEILERKCPAYIEGYCCNDSQGYLAVYPWRDLALLEEFQAHYEAQQTELLAAADAAYQEGVNSVYD